MEKQWAGTTYGNNWMHRWLIRILRHMDVRVLYVFVAVFVIPVCLVVNPATGVTYRYFRRHWRFSPLKSAKMTYKNFMLFSQVVIDRFAMYAGKKFDMKEEGGECFQRLASSEAGFIMLSAHIGNYELAGYTLQTERKRFNALVFGGEKESVMENRNRMFEGTNIRMISIGDGMSHLFEINAALAEGEIVSMPADRMLGSRKSIVLPFLGEEARFPVGPFSIATMRGLECIAVNVMKTSAVGYTIYVAPLHYDKSADRGEQTLQLARGYVGELERILAMYPEQWYNYYEFWGNEQRHP